MTNQFKYCIKNSFVQVYSACVHVYSACVHVYSACVHVYSGCVKVNSARIRCTATVAEGQLVNVFDRERQQ